ncbi:MAG: hypothetical protein Q9180_007137 [Flavoplaca navasiana]
MERKASIDQTILSPGTVSINVKGAFIVDEQPSRPSTPSDGDDGAQHDTEIRLPNHEAVVSHVALDGYKMSSAARTVRDLERCPSWLPAVAHTNSTTT